MILTIIFTVIAIAVGIKLFRGALWILGSLLRFVADQFMWVITSIFFIIIIFALI